MTRASRLTRVLAVIGTVAIVAALAGVVVAVGVVRRGFSARPSPSAAEEWLALKVRRLAVPERYRTMKNPAAFDDATRKDAMAHWADHCAGCHANDGSGETSMGQLMYPRPPDMRKARTQDLSDGELYYAINQGIRLTGMPAWGEPGDDDLGSWELVGFVRTLPTLTPAQLEEMKTMNPVPASVMKARQDEDDFLDEETPPAKTHDSHSHEH